MKKSTWEVILKIIIAVASAVAGALGVSACGLEAVCRDNYGGVSNDTSPFFWMVVLRRCTQRLYDPAPHTVMIHSIVWDCGASYV